MNLVTRFLQNEEGAAAIEYALLASLIAAVIIATVLTLGKQVCGLYTNVGAMLIGAASNGNTPCA